MGYLIIKPSHPYTIAVILSNAYLGIYVHIYIYIYIYMKVKLVTVVEGDQKAPFSIATTPRYWGGHYSFPWIVSLYP